MVRELSRVRTFVQALVLNNSKSFHMVQFLFHHSTMFNGWNLVGFVNRLTFYNGHNLSRASLFSVDSLFCGEVRLGQGPWPVSEIVQLVKQRTVIPSVVGSSPRPGTNTFLPNVTLLVSEVIRRSASGLNDKGWGGVRWNTAGTRPMIGCPASSVGSSPTPRTNTFLPNVTLVSVVHPVERTSLSGVLLLSGE